MTTEQTIETAESLSGVTSAYGSMPPCRHPLPARHRERGQHGTFGRLTCGDCGAVIEERSKSFLPHQ